jgi:hypothetical protein
MAMKIFRKLVIRGSILLIFAFAATAYGVGSTVFAWFPADLVLNYINDASTWKNRALQSKKRLLPINSLPQFDEVKEAYTVGAITASQERSTDVILMTGGMYQHLEACPELGCIAWIMDQKGKLLHVWPFTELVRNGVNVALSDQVKLLPITGHLFADGSLFVQLQFPNNPYDGILALFDSGGALVWHRKGNNHHWSSVEASSAILSPSYVTGKSIYGQGRWKVSRRCRLGKRAVVDAIMIVEPDRSIVNQIDLAEVFIASGYQGLLPLSYTPCDPFHLTSVTSLPPELASSYPGLSAGDLLVSLLSLNTIAIIDRASFKIKWIVSGLTQTQYSPQFIGSNKLLVIETPGGSAETKIARLVTIDLGTRERVQVFPKASGASEPAEFFHPDIYGAQAISLSKDFSHAVITNPKNGKVIVIDLVQNEIVWEYVNSHRITEYWKTHKAEVMPKVVRFNLTSAQFVDRKRIPVSKTN